MLRFSQIDSEDDITFPKILTFHAYEFFMDNVPRDIMRHGKDTFGAIRGPSGDVLWTSVKMQEDAHYNLDRRKENYRFRVGTEDEFLFGFNEFLDKIVNKDNRDELIHLINDANRG